MMEELQHILEEKDFGRAEHAEGGVRTKEASGEVENRRSLHVHCTLGRVRAKTRGENELEKSMTLGGQSILERMRSRV